jgi:hypothetical protein
VIPPELTSRQRELLAAVHAREIAWAGSDLELVDEARGAHLSCTDVDALYGLEMAGLVDVGATRPHLTAGGQWLLAERRRPVSPWVALAAAVVVGLAVWGALAVVLVVTGWLW